MARKKKTEDTSEVQTVNDRSLEVVHFLEKCAVGAAESLLTEDTNNVRDKRGLIKGIEYKFKENGLIDWRAMLPSEHLALNKDVYSKRNINVFKLSKEEEEELKAKATDKELVILLSGIKYLAKIRGYKSVIQTPLAIENRAVCSCVITWIPNFETEFQEVIYSDVGGANVNNTTNFAQNYLDSIAANRAFARAVRNFLGIEVVAYDELGDANASIERTEEIVYSSPEPLILLKNVLQKANWTFKDLQTRLINKPREGDNVEEIKQWTSLEDIPRSKCVDLTERIKKYLADKQAS